MGAKRVVTGALAGWSQADPQATPLLQQSPLPAAGAATRKRSGWSPAIRIFTPVGYEPGYAYPLLVWLHSAGAGAEELGRIMPSISLRNFAAAAPEGLATKKGDQRNWCQDEAGIGHACEEVARAIDHARLRMNIAPTRIFLAGLGAGGTMAFRVAFAMGSRIAGVVSVNGGLPSGSMPLGRWTDCRKIPVLWVHCREHSEFSEDRLCDQLRLLHVAGFDLQVRQYPGDEAAHQQTWSDVNRWLMERVTGGAG